MPGQAIPASQVANVVPGVLAAGGTGLQMVGLCLTNSTRPPIGQVLSFQAAADVGDYFGFQSTEYSIATVYFLGFDNAPQQPSEILFTQYNWQGAVAPFLRGGPIGDQLTLAQLKAIAPGTLTISLNGVSTTSSSINLASATSFSNAAATIATALGINDASFTGILAPSTASVTGSISGNVLTVSVVGSGVLVIGGTLSGTGVAAGTQIQSQITGTAGGVGTYQVSIGSQAVSSTAISETYATLTASSVTGTIYPGQVLAGAGVTAGSALTANVGGTGGAGTYVVSPTQTVGSEAMTSGAATVTYDSTSAAFVITGGTPGAPGTITYASGAIATALDLTSATGAVLSQGAAQASPLTFMAALWDTFQNFVTFFTTGIADQQHALAFAEFTNGLDTELAYIFWDTSAANYQPSPATTTAAIIAAGYSGTAPFYAPVNGVLDAAMLSGMIASVGWGQPNGRTDFAFLTQTGIPSEIISGSQATQLKTNGMNFYGKYGSPSADFVWTYPGVVTGPFLWLDTYTNAIWLKNILQLALLQLFQNVRSIPFNAAGYALITEALGGGPATNAVPAGPIQQALSFGAIRSGVTLSGAQVAAVVNQFGQGAVTALQGQGWFLSVVPASPQVRQARGPLQVDFLYCDGGSVQVIDLSSVALL